MPKYHVVVPVKHDGERYTPGDIVEISETDSSPLLVAGAIEPLVEMSVAKHTPPVSDEGAEERPSPPPKAPRKKTR